MAKKTKTVTTIDLDRIYIDIMDDAVMVNHHYTTVDAAGQRFDEVNEYDLYDGLPVDVQTALDVVAWHFKTEVEAAEDVKHKKKEVSPSL